MEKPLFQVSGKRVGLYMTKHKDFTVATDVQVYFCDPQSPWQRRTNENTNCSYGNTSHEAQICLGMLKAARPSLAALESTTEKDPRIPNSCR